LSLPRALSACLCGLALSQSCSNVRTLGSYNGANGTTCVNELTNGVTCTLICSGGTIAVGNFHCLFGTLVGVPGCYGPDTSVRTVPGVAGTFQVSTVRRRSARMGLEFRDSVRIALAHSLVIAPGDIVRLEIVLHQEATTTHFSLIDVNYEILLDEAQWQLQVTSDLRNIVHYGAPVRVEFENMMAPQFIVENMYETQIPMSFSNEVVYENSEGLSTLDPGGSDYATLVIVAVLAMAVVLMGVGLYSGRQTLMEKRAKTSGGPMSQVPPPAPPPDLVP